MIPGIYSAATAMDQAALRHEVVARNLAHSDIPGYRRQILRQQTFEASLGEAQQNALTHKSLGASTAGMDVDLTPGGYQRTDSPTDFAIQGDGYFVVEGPNGPLYTRNGAFHIGEKGQLVTSDGLPVVAESGSLNLPADSSAALLNVKADGSASVNGIEIGRIKVVRFQDAHQLKPEGITLYRAPQGVTAQDSTAQILQGMREHSNVHPVQEMIELISATRAHESAQRAMQSLSNAIEHRIDLQRG